MPPGSSVVIVGSSAAFTAHYPAAFTTSKWGLRGLTAHGGVKYVSDALRPEPS